MSIMVTFVEVQNGACEKPEVGNLLTKYSLRTIGKSQFYVHLFGFSIHSEVSIFQGIFSNFRFLFWSAAVCRNLCNQNIVDIAIYASETFLAEEADDFN